LAGLANKTLNTLLISSMRDTLTAHPMFLDVTTIEIKCVENLKRRDIVGDIGIGEGIILKWMLSK